MKIIANEFVMPIAFEGECHASHFVTLGDGRVFCVFFKGSKEGRDDVRIYGSFRNPADGSWSEPVDLSDDDGVPHWNPVLFRRKDGSVMLFYKIGKKIAEWKTFCRISKDNCETWGDSFELVKGDKSGGRGPVRNKAIYSSDGRIIAPASTEIGEWKCFFDISEDEGKTWTRTKDIVMLDEHLDRSRPLEWRGIIQPAIWETENGFHALLRCSEGNIFRTNSVDGVNWSIPQPTNMPNNNSGIDAVCLPDGRIILVCNPVSEDWGARSPISLYVSNDNGNNFELLTHLTTMPGEYSYPAVMYEEGKLHITYTWQRRTIQYFCFEL